MPAKIAEGLYYYTRGEWGARTDIPRLGYSVSRSARTHGIFHHTVVVDDDATPNTWETVQECFGKQRQLQVIRPDLGLDVPYSFVFYRMADRKLSVLEGRGLDRTGAHTYGHNTKGIGIAGEGNFQLPASFVDYRDNLSRFLGWLKFDQGMTNLGSDRPARAVVYGHQDFDSTACPGYWLYQTLPSLSFKKEDDKMKPEDWTEVNRLINNAKQEVIQQLGVEVMQVRGKSALYLRVGHIAIHIPSRTMFNQLKLGNLPRTTYEPQDPRLSYIHTASLTKVNVGANRAVWSLAGPKGKPEGAR